MEDDLIVDGTIVLNGLIATNLQARWMEGGCFAPGQLRRALSAFDGDVEIWLNSHGGDPVEGEAMRVMLAEHDGTVTVRVAGQASSAASLMAMGADRIEISEGSFMLIHDPSTITFGNAADHVATAERLNAMSETYASVYARRTGLSADEVRRIMQAETLLSAADAIAQGFADAMLEDAEDIPAEVAAASMTAASARAAHASAIRMLREAHARAHTVSDPGANAVSSGTTPAIMATNQEGIMDPDELNEGQAQNGSGTTQVAAPPANPATSTQMAASPTNVQDAIRADRQRASAIRMAARPHVMSGVLTEDFVEALVDEGVTVEMASHRMLTEMAGSQPAINARSPAGSVRVGREDRDSRREGLTAALTARMLGETPEDERARPYLQMSIHEMAAAASGQASPGFGSYASREQVIMSAMHTSSDFPNILSTSVNRVLVQNYELVERTFTSISREMTFNDFRPHDVVRPDEFPTLTKVNEAGEIQFGTLGDSKETVALAAYATGVTISRQALVNDDLGAIQEVIDNAAAIVPEFEEDVFWKTFLANGNLADGKAMFHADHGNLAGTGTAITVAAIAAGRQALRTMKAADGERVIRMNEPSILLVGPAKQTEAEQFVNQIIQPTKASDTNPFTGKLRVVVTESITNNAWYLLVDPQKRTVNMRHGYLRDRTAPRVRVDEPFGVQGMRMTLEQDFGVGGVNYRGGYKNPGA